MVGAEFVGKLSIAQMEFRSPTCARLGPARARPCINRTARRSEAKHLVLLQRSSDSGIAISARTPGWVQRSADTVRDACLVVINCGPVVALAPRLSPFPANKVEFALAPSYFTPTKRVALNQMPPSNLSPSAVPGDKNGSYVHFPSPMKSYLLSVLAIVFCAGPAAYASWQFWLAMGLTGVALSVASVISAMVLATALFAGLSALRNYLDRK